MLTHVIEQHSIIASQIAIQSHNAQSIVLEQPNVGHANNTR